MITALHADQCALSQFPAPLFSLPSLCVLGLSNNALPAVPIDIQYLKRLEALDLRNNNLTSLLPQLALLPLRSLLVEGNILRTMRRTVLEQGTPALLAYLKDRLPE
jgi:Leucine-rich repeat (LRR) protein